jgi:hypothetical protein
MLGEEPVILWHARDESTLDGLMLYQISPVSDCLAAKKVACRLLLGGGGEPWPVRFVYTPFFKPPWAFSMNTTRKARSKNTALKVIAVTKYTSLLDHTSNVVSFVRC